MSCPRSLDVSKEDCAAAGLSVGGELRNGTPTTEGSWNIASAGCSLLGNEIRYNWNDQPRNDGGSIPVCKPFSFDDASCYFCDKYIFTMFILMTHNSYAIPEKVGSPNQNNGVAKQFKDG